MKPLSRSDCIHKIVRASIIDTKLAPTIQHFLPISGQRKGGPHLRRPEQLPVVQPPCSLGHPNRHCGIVMHMVQQEEAEEAAEEGGAERGEAERAQRSQRHQQDQG